MAFWILILIFVALDPVLLIIQFTCLIVEILQVAELDHLSINLKVMMQQSSVYRWLGDPTLFLLIAVLMCTSVLGIVIECLLTYNFDLFQWSPDKPSVFGSTAEDGILNIWDHDKVWTLKFFQVIDLFVPCHLSFYEMWICILCQY